MTNVWGLTIHREKYQNLNVLLSTQKQYSEIANDILTST